VLVDGLAQAWQRRTEVAHPVVLGLVSLFAP
jgi:hypothetical protein